MLSVLINVLKSIGLTYAETIEKGWLLSGCFRILVSRSTTRRCLRMTNRLLVLAVEALCVLSVLVNVLKSIGLTYAETIEKGWLLSGSF